MFNVIQRTLPHFILIWYLSSVINVNPKQIAIALTAFLSIFLTVIWNVKDKLKNWYWKLDFTYMTAWALLEISLGAIHHDITVFLTTVFVNQFIFFTNSIMDKTTDIPMWKYVLWNNMCFAKTIIIMTLLKIY
jgi:hypothetical protein